MAPTTYHSRVQRVLSDVARHDEESIPFVRLVREVCAQFLQGDVLPNDWHERHVLDAVKREVRAHRVTLDVSSHLHVVVITLAGTRFYKEWGDIPLYDAQHPRLRYLSLRELHKYSRILTGVMDEIKDNLPFSAHPLPQVEQLCNRVQQLEHTNGELYLALNYEERDKRHLTAARAAAVQAGAMIPPAGPSTSVLPPVAPSAGVPLAAPPPAAVLVPDAPSVAVPAVAVALELGLELSGAEAEEFEVEMEAVL
ncbi:hypothetical protein GY45DRAFT_1376236 [Cubamyces sp. BRFM 1775]|nr:hypothetical protein GY45DRAFT_1376236 [Cubamyces sp. BRFM 1775]